MKIEIEPIGYVESDLNDRKDAPRHHTVSDRRGIIHVNPELTEGLYRIEERSHLVILFHFNRSDGTFAMKQTPPSSGEEKGVFSTCSPHRPNSIGMDIVELEKVEGNRLFVKNIDMLDGTPVIDIKPYRPIKQEMPINY